MRTIPTGLLNSLTLCNAAKVMCANGTVWGLTDARVAFVYGGVTYSPLNGIDVSTVTQGSGTSPGSMEFVTIETALLSQITQADLQAHVYDNARVLLFEIDYANPSAGPAIIDRYIITRAEFHDTNSRLTLESTMIRLKVATGRSLGSSCDVLKFGDIRCDPSQTIRAARSFSRTVSAVIDNFTFQVSGDSQPADYYSFGEAIWTSGANAACPPGEVKKHFVPSAGVCEIILRDPMGYPVSVGDVVTLVFGCDRRYATCQSVTNASNPSGTNIENFQGFRLPIPDPMQTVGKF